MAMAGYSTVLGRFMTGRAATECGPYENRGFGRGRTPGTRRSLSVGNPDGRPALSVRAVVLHYPDGPTFPGRAGDRYSSHVHPMGSSRHGKRSVRHAGGTVRADVRGAGGHVLPLVAVAGVGPGTQALRQPQDGPARDRGDRPGRDPGPRH